MMTVSHFQVVCSITGNSQKVPCGLHKFGLFTLPHLVCHQPSLTLRYTAECFTIWEWMIWDIHHGYMIYYLEQQYTVMSNKLIQNSMFLVIYFI